MATPRVPFLDLVTLHRELEDELIAVTREIVRSASFNGGPHVEALEREFAAFCGAEHCVALASGTDAVRFALMGTGVGHGDAVITVPNTFIATVEGISQAGAATEFVDVDERTYGMSPARLAEYLAACSIDASTRRPLGQRTRKPIKAIVAVHLYGQVVDIDRIQDIASRYGLFVIEDACQAHGARYSLHGEWRRAGTFGKAAAFSFYPGKNLGACGEAGAITTDDAEIAKFVRMIRDHGQSKKYYHELEGYNGRLDALQAAYLRIKLRRLEAWNEQRRAAAHRYNDLLAPLARAGFLALPYEPASSESCYHLYVIRTKDRDGLAAHLNAQGIQTGLHYPVPVHKQNCYRTWAVETLPVTERAAAEILSLPMFPGLTPEQQQTVVAEIEAFAQVGLRS